MFYYIKVAGTAFNLLAESRLVFPVVTSVTQAFFKMERVSIYIKGKKIELVYFDSSTSISLLRSCKFKGFKIDKKILNKFFLRKKREV